MQQLKNISRLSLLLLIMVAGILTFSSTTQAANFKPYEYTFVEDETASKNFHGIRGVKQLNITFDQPIPVTDVSLGDISVVATTETKGATPTSVPMPIVEKPVISGNTVSVSFKNLDYIDYTDATKSYKLVIKSSAGLYVGQAEDLELPFAIHDILPGFKSVFLDLPASEIESKVFINNAPRDIFVHIPKYYLNKIETIHRYKGVVPTQEAAALTNIDILTDPAITRLKVNWNGSPLRDLEPHPSVKGFTLGYANDPTIDLENIGEFSLRAYDHYGRILDSSNFKINFPHDEYLANTNIKVSDYITKKASDFGKTYTLYDLMSKPKIFENILTSLSVEDLNKLGVTYANQLRTVAVNNIEQLQLAIQNPQITTINLTENIDLSDLADGLMINRDVTINGNKDENANYQLIGDVTLGDGSKNLRINLNNLDITGTLTISTGEGNVIATNVKVDGTDGVTSASVIIISGGINSIHFINFEAINGIYFANLKPVRLVVSNSEEQSKLNATLASDQQVTLEGTYGTVTAQHANAQLKVNGNISIDKWVVNPGMQLTVEYPVTAILPPEISGIIYKPVETEEDEEKEIVINLGKATAVEGILGVWGNAGKEVIFPRENEVISEITAWEVSNKNAFGMNSEVKLTGTILTILNLNIFELTEKEIILLADYNGKKYQVTVPVKVTIE
ncbi:pectate lyase-like adhesive domain-containing protein [Solibacillus sp. FSL W7-1464]|uniref:pectate lyase-like adhesive domain-containing protein n=1 Tax=Solibacillus sp. FSL W7-1464 TaxID=2921706 RepID=UPI0030F6D731